MPTETNGNRNAKRLVLVEGLSGSGKTTTARHLQQHLLERGVSARAYGEGDHDNPIAIGSLLPNLASLISRYAKRTDFLDDWKNLALELRANDRTVILEGRFIQNAAMFRCLAGLEEGAVPHTRSILSCIEDLHPLLIYLRVSDPASHAQRALDESPPEWVELVLRQFERTPWFRSRGVKGSAGWVQFLSAWQLQLESVTECLDMDILTLSDSHLDWPQAVDQARAAVVSSRLD